MSDTTAEVTEDDRTNSAVRMRAEAEFMEMPGLKLTPAQAARFWHLDLERTTAMLDAMVDAGVLFRARDGGYVLLSAR